MKRFTLANINELDRRYRAQMMNCISGVKSVNLIGTKNNAAQENLAIFNSVVHIGANPPLLGFIQRPTTVDRHTYENIVATEYYTINSVTEALSAQSHQTAASYKREESEFQETSLGAIYKNGFFAPYVENSPLQIGLKLEDVIPIPVNDTKLVIGKVIELYVNPDLIEVDGHLKLYEAGIVGGVGLDTYVKTNKQSRYSYAKPDETLKKL